MLQLREIYKSYPQRGIVLENLDLTVTKGDSLAITGPSGSGKTTIMNLLGALDKPDKGDIVFMDKSVLQLSPDEASLYRNKNIGFVFQDHLLLRHLRIYDNILLPVFASRPDPETLALSQAHAEMLMKKTGIDSLKDKYPFEISGGEAQRATLVRALINKPSVLLADEPTGSLDGRNADILGELLVDLNNDMGITVIVVTHSPNLAGKMKRHLVLENGTLRS
jgi:ABC-type lipoprotein export system ATPase subunit